MISKLYVLTEDGEFKKVDGIKIDYVPSNSSNQNVFKTNIKKFVDVNELSNLINRSKPSIYSLVHKRKIPHIKRGKRLYFQWSKIEKWLNDGEVPTHDELTQKANDYLSKNRL